MNLELLLQSDIQLPTAEDINHGLAAQTEVCSKIWSQKREKKLRLAKYACKFGRMLITHLFLRRSLNIESAGCKNLACFKVKSA